MSGRLSDSVAVVTGGGGINEATCLRFAEAGAAALAVDCNGDTVTEMAATVRDRTGREALGVGADEESWDRILDVNLKGTAFCSKHLVPAMDGGSVVNVSSNGADVARPKWSRYDATKGALVSMTQDMACDHAGDGVRVNAVSPGGHRGLSPP